MGRRVSSGGGFLPSAQTERDQSCMRLAADPVSIRRLAALLRKEEERTSEMERDRKERKESEQAESEDACTLCVFFSRQNICNRGILRVHKDFIEGS